MSGNEANTGTFQTDRRVRRTRDTLGDALIELMQEHPFESVTVQQVLDRAGVGRSTFYAHFRDKDDLFLSDVEDFFAGMATWLDRTGAAPERVVPVRELFTHVAEARTFYRALVTSGKVRDVFELGEGFFARSIEQRVAARLGPAVKPAQLKAQAHALAAAMFALLTWWLDHEGAATAQEMDATFHAMVWNGLGGLR